MKDAAQAFTNRCTARGGMKVTLLKRDPRVMLTVLAQKHPVLGQQAV